VSEYFSAMVRLLTTVDEVGPTSYTRTLFIFTAANWEAARLRAIELGRQAEASYQNEDGNRVERRLLYVETLDALGPRINDGMEVYSEPVSVEEDFSPPTIEPEDSRPTQSGV
jgi:hypothetical protein